MMTEAGRLTFPVFVFRRDAEADGMLAGQLFYNSFGRRYPRARQLREIAEIVRGLTADAQSGHLPPDGMKIGWPGVGLPPVHAVDTNDAEIMASWNARTLGFFVRVDRNGDQTITLDSPRS
jgi:hypothetical protein